jgi:hypothetical protein
MPAWLDNFSLVFQCTCITEQASKLPTALCKKETHKGILGILNQHFSVTLLDIDSECLVLKN